MAIKTQPAAHRCVLLACCLKLYAAKLISDQHGAAGLGGSHDNIIIVLQASTVNDSDGSMGVVVERNMDALQAFVKSLLMVNSTPAVIIWCCSTAETSIISGKHHQARNISASHFRLCS